MTAKQTQQSKEIQQAFEDIFVAMSIDERKEFIRIFHEVLKSAKIYTLTDADMRGMTRIFQSYLGLKNAEKRIVYKVLKRFFSVKAIRNTMLNAMMNYKKLNKKK